MAASCMHLWGFWEQQLKHPPRAPVTAPLGVATSHQRMPPSHLCAPHGGSAPWGVNPGRCHQPNRQSSGTCGTNAVRGHGITRSREPPQPSRQAENEAALHMHQLPNPQQLNATPALHLHSEGGALLATPANTRVECARLSGPGAPSRGVLCGSVEVYTRGASPAPPPALPAAAFGRRHTWG
jgi:hypothetical protein